MSPEALQVTTARLRELAAKQGQAAAEIVLAADAASGVASSVRASHGVISSSTADAIEAIQQARREARDSMAGESRALSGNLTAAADRYEATDLASVARLDEQLQSGPTAPRRPR